jgi:multidrug transporter EmrE-like cation transporter
MNRSATAGTLLTLVELVGDTSLRYYAKTDTSLFLGIGTAAYLGLVYILQWAFRSEKLAIVNGYWDAFSNILTTLVAYFILGEALTRTQLIGLFLIGGGIYLL